MSDVSLWVPSLYGGGAEKVARYIIKICSLSNKKIQVVTASGFEANELTADNVIVNKLPSDSALFSVHTAIQILLTSKSGVYFFTLNYIFFSIVARIIHPRARIVIRIANTLSEEFKSDSRIRRLLSYIGFFISIFSADLVIAQCEYMAYDLQVLYPKRLLRKMIVVYNPVFEASFKSVSASIVNPVRRPDVYGKYILTAASWKPQKDFDTLLRAFAEFGNCSIGNVKLLIAGCSKDNAELQAKIKEYGVNPHSVEILGFVDNLDHYIRGSLLCVLSSHYEGLSNFILESIRLDKTILATDCPGGSRELSRLYPGLILFDPFDFSALASMMAEYICAPRSWLSRVNDTPIGESKVRSLYLKALFGRSVSL